MTDDYLNVTEVTFGWEYFAESPAMLKMDGHYFIFGSHLTGWDPNDNVSSNSSPSLPLIWLLTNYPPRRFIATRHPSPALGLSGRSLPRWARTHTGVK